MAPDVSNYAKRTKETYTNTLRWWGYYLSQRFLALLFCTVKKVKYVNNVEKLPPHSRFILSANHTSNFDPFMVGHGILKYNTAFMCKKELFENIFTRFYFDLIGCISVNRGKANVSTIRSCKVALDAEQWCLGIFPEGSRKEEGHTDPPKKGAAFIAKATKASLFPAGIVQAGPNNRYVTIVYGDPIPYEGQTIDELTALLMTRIEELKDEARELGPKLHGYKVHP